MATFFHQTFTKVMMFFDVFLRFYFLLIFIETFIISMNLCRLSDAFNLRSSLKPSNWTTLEAFLRST